MGNRKTFLTSTAVAAVAFVQVISSPPRRRRFAVFGRSAPTAIIALLFGISGVQYGARPKVSRSRIGAVKVVTGLRRQPRPAHSVGKPRFLYLHEPDFLTSVAIRTACDDSFNFNLVPAAGRVIARARTSASWAFGLPDKQPRVTVRERLSRYQASSGRFAAATTTAGRSDTTAKAWVHAGQPASLPGLPQRLSPSVP
jgi:hypothetical protein